MKKFVTLIASIACFLVFTVVTVNAQPWTAVGPHIINPNNPGFVGIGNPGAPATLLDVARLTSEPTVRVFNMGGPGGATFQMSDAVSGANWKFKATASGGFKIRDQAFALDVMSIEASAAANSIYVEAGGNVGIGLTNPLEKLHISGAVTVGTTAGLNAGTIRWNGTNFQGRKAAEWVNLEESSRIRAYQVDPTIQIIPPSVWTPVNFNMEAPLPIGWDTKAEFTPAPAAAVPAGPDGSWFTAIETGYYQVNSRCEFQIPNTPGALTPTSFVAIAIWWGPAPGASVSYAIGNHLQVAYTAAGQLLPLTCNSAPNVSDVVYLMAGQIISIRVWQSTLAPLPLIQGSDRLYVSIHKVS